MAKNVSVVKDEVPATTEDYADRYAGEGTRVDSEHTITPQVRILQGGSPQVKKASVAYVDGAAPGMIYLSSYFKPLVPGDVGIVFQPCLFQAPWDVSTPKSENQLPTFVGRYDEPQPGWTKRRSDKGFVYYLTPEGNVANQVHLHVGLVHIDDQVLPYAIRFAGTGLFISKQFNGLIGSRLTETGKPAARFTFTYRMKVKSQVNSFGEWGQWSISADGKATAPHMDIGHELAIAFRERRATVEDAGDEAKGDDDGTM